MKKIDNHYIIEAENLFNAVFFSDETTEYSLQELPNNKYKLRNETAYNIYKKNIQQTKELTSKPMSFKELWDFCQFVRWAEKTLFYENEPNSRIYVDSEMNSKDSREFQLYVNGADIRFKLEKKFDVKSKQRFEVINININRSFGKQMKNTFQIVNQEVVYIDDSDLYLINTINQSLGNSVYNTYREVMASIWYKRCCVRDDYGGPSDYKEFEE